MHYVPMLTYWLSRASRNLEARSSQVVRYTFVGFSPDLTVCLALSREMGAPHLLLPAVLLGLFTKLRPAFKSRALAVPAF